MSNVLHDESAVLRQERVQAWGRLLAVVLFVATLFVLSPEPDQIRASRLAAVTVLMSVLWLTQAIPIAATSLIPLDRLPNHRDDNSCKARTFLSPVRNRTGSSGPLPGENIQVRAGSACHVLLFRYGCAVVHSAGV